MKYQRVPMPPENLEDTVKRYNMFVDRQRDLARCLTQGYIAGKQVAAEGT